MITTEETLTGFFFRDTNYGTVALGKIYSENLLVGQSLIIKKQNQPKFKIVNDILKLSYQKGAGKKITLDLGEIEGGKNFIKQVNQNLLV